MGRFVDVNDCAGRTLEAAVKDVGFHCVKLLNAEAVNQCYSLFLRTDRPLLESRYNTLEINDTLARGVVNKGLFDLIGHEFAKFLTGYKTVAFNFAVKRGKGGDAFEAHIDDTHCDESNYVSFNVWIPLTDVDEYNGALYVVPRSHRLPQPIKGIGLPFAFSDKIHLIDQHKVSLRLSAGDALFFDSRLIHGSPKNNTTDDRPAIICGLIPQEARPIVYMNYQSLPPHQAECFHAPPEFYDKVRIGHRPEGFRSMGMFEWKPVEISDEHFLTIIRGYEVEASAK